MNLKSLLARPFASLILKQIRRSAETAIEDQEKILKELITKAQKTEFGTDHNFAAIKDYEGFKAAVPIRDYEQLKPYIQKIKDGKHNVLWRGRPAYFAKTSGTTSGIKYIPITNDSIPNHINTARNALLCYMAETGNYDIANGKMIFLSGSPELERIGDIPTGRLSGIVNHHIPTYLRTNQLPGYETNCISEWEEKLDKIVNETIGQNMTVISGIPPWMQMYFDRLMERSGKKIAELFPHFKLMVQGGVNFEPYRPRLYDSIGEDSKVDCIELYPASEGFFAFQDTQKMPGLLLNTNSGIFFEFVSVQELGKENPHRIALKDVKPGENYALIINSNAGLWGYSIGDTVKFLSINPYRLVVSGRVKHFLSAFGEHVIGEEVEFALMKAANQENIKVVEFTVAPFISQQHGKSYHEWFIEFENEPENPEAFAQKIDDNLREKNVYYDDLIVGNILQRLKIQVVEKNGFINYMKSIGKLGGQNKVPRLCNERTIVTGLQAFSKESAGRLSQVGENLV